MGKKQQKLNKNTKTKKKKINNKKNNNNNKKNIEMNEEEDEREERIQVSNKEGRSKIISVEVCWEFLPSDTIRRCSCKFA